MDENLKDDDEDKDLKELFSDTPQSWMSYLQYISRVDSSDIMACDTFDPIAHAAADASKVYNASVAADLPWQSSEAFLQVPGPWSKDTCFWYDFVNDECFSIFSVSKDEFLTEKEIVEFWPQVEAGDRAEVKFFVDHEVFSLDLAAHAKNVVDAVWVRKWKSRRPPVVKSRMCGRGFMDSQRQSINRHSSTASALSHRLAMTLGAQAHWLCEAFDVSTAFLQGLRFQEIEARARELGHECKRQRTVWLLPPANVWRHLRLLHFTTVQDVERHLFRLLLHKAMYGLVDGPILFQMAFIHYLLSELRFYKSLHDDNFLYKYSYDMSEVICVIVLHVDDLLFFGG